MASALGFVDTLHQTLMDASYHVKIYAISLEMKHQDYYFLSNYLTLHVAVEKNREL